MTDDLQTGEIDLGGDIFRFHGPQTELLIYYGTVGETPEYSNDILERYYEKHGDKHGAETFPNADVTLLSTGSSPWILLQFPESRRDEIVEQLREIIAKTKGEESD